MPSFTPGLGWIVRIVLGSVMVYASYHKILDPPDFAKILFNYKLFPAESLNPLAIYVPWLEAICGVALIVGVGRRGASFLAMAFFTSFVVFLAYNLSRECPTICGCFSTHAEGASMTDAEKFSEMKKEIWLVDVPCLIAATYAFMATFVHASKTKPEAA